MNDEMYNNNFPLLRAKALIIEDDRGTDPDYIAYFLCHFPHDKSDERYPNYEGEFCGEIKIWMNPNGTQSISINHLKNNTFVFDKIRHNINIFEKSTQTSITDKTIIRNIISKDYDWNAIMRAYNGSDIIGSLINSALIEIINYSRGALYYKYGEETQSMKKLTKFIENTSDKKIFEVKEDVFHLLKDALFNRDVAITSEKGNTKDDIKEEFSTKVNNLVNNVEHTVRP